VGLVAHIDEGRAAASSRGSTRRTVRLEVVGTTDNVYPAAMIVHDLSLTGLLIETGATIAVGQKLAVELPEVGSFAAEAVWSSGHYVGCKFEEVLSQAAISAALLRGDWPGFEYPAGVANSGAVQELQARVQCQLTQGRAQIAAADTAAESAAEYNRLPLHVRGRILLSLCGVSAGSWALILWGVGVI